MKKELRLPARHRAKETEMHRPLPLESHASAGLTMTNIQIAPPHLEQSHWEVVFEDRECFFDYTPGALISNIPLSQSLIKSKIGYCTFDKRC